MLKTNVTNNIKDNINLNSVDYETIKQDENFSKIISYLKNFNLENLQTQNEKLAFWINVYNIAAVKIIIENYPTKSIKNIRNLINPVWKKDAIKIQDKFYSLREIEHEILRKMNEPRIHFAIVCASLSCPDMRAEVYTADYLETQLDSQVQNFIENKTKGVKISGKAMYISKIFKWFADDFEMSGGIKNFIQQYLKKDISDLKIKYIKYNWKLNGL